MTDAVASTPSIIPSTSNDGVKIPTPDLFIFKDEPVPIEVMTDLIFEDIGGQELLTISRNDLVSGQNIMYQPIKNLSSLYLQYNPQNILNLQDTSSTFFKNYPIKFEKSIPDIETSAYDSLVFIDANGDLVILVAGLESDEQVEVQILTKGSILSGTIYEVNN